jgi:hypothetical protein
MSKVTNESAAGLQQVARAAEDLNKLTDSLQQLVSQFKVKDGINKNLRYSIRQDGKLIEANTLNKF